MSDRAPIDLGGGVSATLRDCECSDPACDHSKPCGMTFTHARPDGQPCEASGWIYFSHAFPSGWTLERLEPLTLSPSLLCTRCQRHGFVREGRWVDC